MNRFFQSMGWGSLVNVLAQWFSPREYGTAMGFMSISYQFGGAVASLFAGTLLAMGVGWRGLFIFPGITLAVIGLLIAPRIVDSPKKAGFPLPGQNDQPKFSTNAERSLGYFERFKNVLSSRKFLIMCGLSFLLTFIRECFTLWAPAYFSDMGNSAASSAFKSAVFPLLGCAGTLLAGWASDRFFSGRRAPLMAVFLTGLVASLGALASLSSTGSSATHSSEMILFLMGCSGFFLFGPYSMVAGGVIALDFGGRQTAGTAAGVLDAAGYLAATVSGFGVARLLSSNGWSVTFGMLAIMAALSLALCFFVWRVEPKP